MDAIFFYGSLRDSVVRRCVFGNTVRSAQIIDARAYGYRTMVYPGETYPVLVPVSGAVAVGQLLLEPSHEALERMGMFEGSEYALSGLAVITADGKTLQARYNRPTEPGLEFCQVWNYEQWQATERDNFLEATRCYMERCWGKMNRSEADVVWQQLHSLRNSRSR